MRKKSFLSLACCAALLSSCPSAYAGSLAGVPISLMSVLFHTTGGVLSGAAGICTARAFVSEASKQSAVETTAKAVTTFVGAIVKEAGEADVGGELVRWFSSGNTEESVVLAIALGVASGCCHLIGGMLSFAAGRVTAKPTRVIYEKETVTKEKNEPRKS